jgi:hypothetical protein
MRETVDSFGIIKTISPNGYGLPPAASARACRAGRRRNGDRDTREDPTSGRLWSYRVIL